VAFVGEELNRMAFTSAANGLVMEDLLAAPEAGSLFEILVDARGQSDYFFGN
jgi:hypothetical protein